jgi:ABC-2 type transport system permease protein
LFFSAILISGLISIAIGMCIGIYSKSASAASGLAVPAGMIFSFIPMLSGFNDGLKRISKYLYGQQMSYLISGKSWDTEAIIICIVNFILIVTLYIVLFKKSKKMS